MNMSHLSHEVETLFERLDDVGVRTACTPFLIYRGRHRHELGLEGLLRRMAVAAKFHHAVWGPEELFYGELYASRRVPCRPTLARPGTRDEYSACVGVELVEQDLYDFLLLGLPDLDYHSHRLGPGESIEAISHADASFERVVERPLAVIAGIEGLAQGDAIAMELARGPIVVQASRIGDYVRRHPGEHGQVVAVLDRTPAFDVP